MSLGLIIVLVLILGSEFVNGWTDSPNAIATVVSTRVMKPKWAVVLATVFNIIGAFLGTEVAKTIGTGIVKPEAINLVTVGAAMVGIITWSTTAWYFGLPTSESHALVAGLAGAGLATAGPSVLLWDGWQKVLIGLAFSSVLGLVGGLGLAWSIRKIFYNMHRAKAKKLFGFLQTISAGCMALSHGSNDGQKFIGTFTLALVLGGVLKEFQVQNWTILLCSVIMGIGTSVGGWRIIKTMGQKMAKIETYQGFAAESAAAGSILLASSLGIPLSTTHTINTSIMGVGAATRFSAVRWGVVKEMVTAWILTFPICGVIGYIMASLFKLFFE
ncbi:MAG TPA: inorganic phosphate transporter [Bacillota bacterium]|nr:inorganic phosphate transporter [Bacillota bacterium]